MNKHGFSMIEMLVSVLIFAIVVAGLAVVLSAGRTTWFTTDMNIRLRDNIRQGLERMARELRESDPSQLQILSAVGPNASDAVRFAVPVICHSGDTLLDTNGDVAHWGAPLTWGCTDSSCMDADNNCATLDYAWVEYRLDNGDLVRLVLNASGQTVREDSFAQQMTGLHMTLNGRMLQVSLTAAGQSDTGQPLSVSYDSDIYLRN